VSSQGAVHVFTHKTLSSLFSASSSFIGVQASAVADATLQNAPSFEYFGQSLEIASSLLLVGAPYYHNLNAVDVGEYDVNFNCDPKRPSTADPSTTPTSGQLSISQILTSRASFKCDKMASKGTNSTRPARNDFVNLVKNNTTLQTIS
jgi:hypothetical protein